LADGVATVASRRPKLPVLVISPAPISGDEADTYRAAGVPVVGSLLDAVTGLKALVDVYASGPGDPVHSDSPSHEDFGAGTPLSEQASKRFLADRGIEMLHEVVAASVEEALAAARQIGYPVVLKAAGAGLMHKSEHQLVALEVADDNAVREQFTELSERGRSLDPNGFEGVIVTRFVVGGVDVLLGVSVDPDFGPMVLLGAGGVLAELIADIAVAPAPMDEPQARALLDSTKISGLLHGHRGSVVCDTDALIDLVVRLSQVAATEADVLQAIDLNPVRVMPADQGVVVLDALVVGSS
jgi:acyl-CoA synthetase (NDP forming)